MATFLAHPLALAIQRTVTSILLGAGVCSTTQHVIAQEIIQYKYDIPSGSLDRALTLFSSQSSIEFAFDPKQLQNLQSKGLKGSYSIDEGFDILLRSHGLRVQRTSMGYTIVKNTELETRDVGQLKALETKASRGNQMDSGSMSSLPIISLKAQDENTYAAKVATIGKTQQTLKEIPQSVSVITKRLCCINIQKLSFPQSIQI